MDNFNKNYKKHKIEKKQCVACYDTNPAIGNIWDNRWSSKDVSSKHKRHLKKQSYMSYYTEKYLPKNSSIIEGGCGLGQVVSELHMTGYQVIGVDTAEETLDRVKKLFPKLPVEVGDVTKLKFKDSYFDGYWSLGVIEHDPDGYDLIIKEMLRVIKPGGYLFLTFPWMNLIRRIKYHLGIYPAKHTDGSDSSETFYQYILPSQQVIMHLEKLGFTIIESVSLSSLYGFLDEFPPLKKLYVKVFNGVGGKDKKKDVKDGAGFQEIHVSPRKAYYASIEHFIDRIFGWAFGHISLLVFKKRHSSY